eukprot:scaffold1669_cov129-Cylindrotheca_fusiformis.AAC.49
MQQGEPITSFEFEILNLAITVDQDDKYWKATQIYTWRFGISMEEMTHWYPRVKREVIPKKIDWQDGV